MENKIFDSLKYGLYSRRSWWYVATARTKARFARTLLGGFWLGLSNLLSVGALGAVYGVVFKVEDINSYIVYLGVGLVAWNSLSSSISTAPNLFEQNKDQILNTNINYIFYTLEEWAFQSQTFIQSFSLVIIGLSFFQPSLLINIFAVGILPIINYLLFMYWVPLMISILGLKYKDLYQLIPVVLQLMFLLSPILYKKETLGSLSITADLNPVFQAINFVRESLITGDLSFKKLLLMTIVNILGLIFSMFLLKGVKKQLPFLV